MPSLWRNRSGAVALYIAIVGALTIGSAVLAIDYGRLTVLRAQMQNAADAAAMAGAAQLDAQANAIARATDVAQNAAEQTSGLAGALTVSNVTVLRQIDPVDLVATTDQNAAFVRVTMTPETTVPMG